MKYLCLIRRNTHYENRSTCRLCIFIGPIRAYHSFPIDYLGTHCKVALILKVRYCVYMQPFQQWAISWSYAHMWHSQRTHTNNVWHKKDNIRTISLLKIPPPKKETVDGDAPGLVRLSYIISVYVNNSLRLYVYYYSLPDMCVCPLEPDLTLHLTKQTLHTTKFTHYTAKLYKLTAFRYIYPLDLHSFAVWFPESGFTMIIIYIVVSYRSTWNVWFNISLVIFDLSLRSCMHAFWLQHWFKPAHAWWGS